MLLICCPGKGLVLELVSVWVLLSGLANIGHSCNKGWFGEECQYLCHCESDKCNATTGCLNGETCHKGWFGPACQYVDLVSQQFTSPTPDWLNDNNDTTCNSDPSEPQVNLTFNGTLPFTWLRLVVNDTDVRESFNITFFENENTEPIQCHSSKVSDTTVDIHCKLETPVHQINVTGEGVGSLCSLYVSGGRNVALKQNTSQTSTNGTYVVLSDKAVDGNSSTTFDDGSCTHTDRPKDRIPTWTVNFKRPVKISRYLLYNRNDLDQNGHRLRGFNLQSFTANGTQVLNYTEPGNVQKVYTVVDAQSSMTSPISSVNVTAKEELDGGGRILTICEAEMFGDVVCDTAHYGRDCENSCNCLNNEPCFVSTGGCPEGCAIGYYGEACNIAKVKVGGDDGIAAWTVAIPVISVAAIGLLLVGLWFWRRSRQKHGDDDEPRQPHLGTDRHHISEKSYHYESARSSIDGSTRPRRSPESTSIAVKDLGEFLYKCSVDYFDEQFKTVPSVIEGATTEVGLSANNKHKNRYKNIVAYDHSRVILIANPGMQEGHYINASYVDGYKKEEKFIASQGPNKGMQDDFIRMLWQEKPDKVVMLTNLVEGGKAKCERYWPEDNMISFGEITVELGTVNVFADYTIRKLRLRKKNEPAHELTQFHYTSWPDKDVPDTPWSLVDFEQRVAWLPTSRPIVVHCSAGVGRTGTFIALRNVMKEAEDTGFIDFYATLLKLRQDRMWMIQTREQYIFLHRAAHVAMICENTTVTASNIQEQIDQLQSFSASGRTNMEEEYKEVCSVCFEEDELSFLGADYDDSENLYANSQIAANKLKNRYNDILPKELNRPILSRDRMDASDYINAVMVPAFTTPAGQILTQLPLPTTVVDFWRLVTQYNVSLIVAFELDMAGTDKTIGSYLPAEDNVPAEFGPFTVQMTTGMSRSIMREHELVIRICKRKKSLPLPRMSQAEEQKVTHLTCNGSNFNTETWLDILGTIRSRRSTTGKRTLFMCRNGADVCGQACALTLLLDRMDSDLCLTIPLVVGALKAIRPQIIPTLEQYQQLYESLLLYKESSSVYTNFGGQQQKPSPQSPRSHDNPAR